jgi:hypothetical protein
LQNFPETAYPSLGKQPERFVAFRGRFPSLAFFLVLSFWAMQKKKEQSLVMRQLSAYAINHPTLNQRKYKPLVKPILFSYIAARFLLIFRKNKE